VLMKPTGSDPARDVEYIEVQTPSAGLLANPR
jgi:hypothetical protein